MDTVISTVIGILAGGGITWFFANKNTKDLIKNNETLITKISELIHERIRLQSTAESAIDALKAIEPTKAAELEETVAEEGRKTNQILQTLPRAVFENLDQHPCPTCGKASRLDGWGCDQMGITSWWFRCQEHGRFPSHRIEDWFDD